MTVCSQCGELAVNTITICQDCIEANEEIESWNNEDLSPYEEHKLWLCNPHECRYCEEQD